MGYVPCGGQIRYPSLALLIENVLIVIDVDGICGNLQPLHNAMKAPQLPRIEHHNAGLEICIRIVHIQNFKTIAHTVATTYIQIGQVINITCCGNKVITQIYVKEFCHVSVYHKIGVKVDNLVIRGQDILRQKTKICLNTDMGVIGIKLIVSDHATYVIEGHLDIFVPGEVPHQYALFIVTNIGIQDHYIIKTCRIRIFQHRINRNAQNGSIVIVRCKNDGNHALSRNPYLLLIIRLKFLNSLRIGKVYTLQLFDFPIFALRTKHVQTPNIKESLRQMTRSAQSFLTILRHIMARTPLVNKRKHPRCIRIKNRLTHDIHVTEALLMAMQKRMDILSIFGVLLDDKGSNRIDVTRMQQRCRMILLKRRIGIPRKLTNVLYSRGNKIITLDTLSDGFIVKTVFFNRVFIDKRIHNFTKRVFLIHGISEVKVAAIVRKAHILRVMYILPSPILRGHLAIHGVFLGNVFSHIIVKHIGKTRMLMFLSGSHLYRLKRKRIGHVNVLVRRHQNTNRLTFIALLHCSSRQILHVLIGHVFHMSSACHCDTVFRAHFCAKFVRIRVKPMCVRVLRQLFF